MKIPAKGGGLTSAEKRIVKALLSEGKRNQDIQALINLGRKSTINSGRITGVKQDASQEAATTEEVAKFLRVKRTYDPITGLSSEDERLVRSRESMLLAVSVFNSPTLKFKTEVFSVLANIAWTYLLHEFYYRKGTTIVAKDGRSLLLGQMIGRSDCPLSEGIRNNLKALKIIRDDVEHKILGDADEIWFSLFQACCLNFDKTLCSLFGNELSLSNQLSVALQFSRLSFEHAVQLQSFDLSEEIKAIDARLSEGMSDAQKDDTEFKFRVIYTLDSASKSKAHFEFIKPESAEGKEIKNILVQYKAADHLYPHKPATVCKIVTKNSGKKFTTHNHVQAWKFFKARPLAKSSHPENTNKDYCIYHPAHNDYTYSEKWIEHLTAIVQDEAKFAAVKSVSGN